MNGPRIAVIGVTGAVGQVLLRLLEERSFPASDIRLCASKRSWGRRLSVNGTELEVEEATPQLLSQVDIAFIAATGDVSRQLAPLAADNGAMVVDKSSAFRMDPDVPLVIPEINGDDLAWHRGIVSSPNCSTTPLAMVLKPLMGLSVVDRVIVDTYQSVSGAGAEAVRELRLQSAKALDGGTVNAQTLPHQIAFNLLPQVETFLDTGYTTEEMKMVDETRKILHEPDLAVSATCVRVPVIVGHSEAVHIEFRDAVTPDEVRQALTAATGVRVLDDPAAEVYPMPIHAEGHDDVLVGRVRQDVSHPRGVALWVACDNLRKGAALNSIQIAEELLSRELLPAQKGRD